MSRELSQKLQKALDESVAAKQAFWKNNENQFFDVAALLVGAIRNGNKILICGNGGSACDSQHFAGELVGKFYKKRMGLPCVALNSDGGILTCVGNDFGYEEVFSRQVQALGKEGDVLIAISTSGNSPNILEALREAKDIGVKTVLITGGTGGSAHSFAEHVLCVSDTKSTPRIQETHAWILHSLCECIDESFG